MADFVGAIDQGTTSTRFMVFDHSGAEVARHQLEHTQIMPRPGWVEHNPVEIWERTSAVIKTVLNARNLRTADLAALGLDQPAGDDPGVEPAHRAGRTATRSCGRTPGPTGSPRPWTGTAGAT